VEVATERHRSRQLRGHYMCMGWWKASTEQGAARRWPEKSESELKRGACCMSGRQHTPSARATKDARKRQWRCQR